MTLTDLKNLLPVGPLETSKRENKHNYSILRAQQTTLPSSSNFSFNIHYFWLGSHIKSRFQEQLVKALIL